MKNPLRLASLLFCLSALTSQAAVTLGFSTGSNAAEGWATSTGDKTATMVWGIIVDVDGDGFDGFLNATSVFSDGGVQVTGGASYVGGFDVIGTSGSGSLPGGQQLSVQLGGLCDDRIYFSSNLMALVGGDVRITSLSSMTYVPGMAAGDKYAIVWFDRTTLGGTMLNGSKYGAWYKDGVSPSTGTILPADPGSYTTAAIGPAGMFGADGAASTRQAGLILGFPEPSTLLLGLLGSVTMLRRRRA